MKKNTLFAIWLISFLSGMIGCNLYLNWAEEETPALEIEPIDIESLLTEIEAKDSAILLMYEKIDSLSKQKQIVTTRTVTLYKKIGVDSSLTSEVIYNHSELDDTLVSYPFNEMVQFRLIQGLEARGLLNICEVEKKCTSGHNRAEK
jgi:hypothetical protein